MNNTGFNIPRHWWGKIIGGVLGLLRGGIAGALFGVFLGHMVDRFLSGLSGVNQSREAFFAAVFTTLGHISKADGRVTQAEIAAAENLMRRLQLTDDERARAIGFFQAGKRADFRLEATLQAFSRQSMLRHELRIMFIELLLEAAMSDGRLAEAEQSIMLRACAALNIPANVFSAMLRARQGGAYYSRGGNSGRRQSTGRPRQAINQSYAALGLKPEASVQEVKRAYRKLVSQYHPDKLVSRGLPEEMMQMAKKRVREINAAYDEIKASRGIK